MEIKGFLTNLGKYNEGELVGEWVTFPIDEEEEEEIFKRIGINEQYEEYFFTDYETDSGLSYEDLGLPLSGYISIKEMNEIAEEFEKLSEKESEILQGIMEECGYTFEYAKEIVEKQNYVLWEDMELIDVAYEEVENELYALGLATIPSFLSCCFSYQDYMRDYMDDYYEIGNDVILILE